MALRIVRWLPDFWKECSIVVYQSIRDATSTAEVRWRMMVKDGASEGIWREAEVGKAWWTDKKSDTCGRTDMTNVKGAIRD
jgi:hypothetical protein